MDKTRNKSPESQLRHLIRGKLNKGSKPHNELEKFLCKWKEQCDKMDLPVLLIKSLSECSVHLDCTTITPTIAWHDKNHYKIDVVKWKTRKAKYKGEYLQSPINIDTSTVKKCKYYRKLNIIGLWDIKKETTLFRCGHNVKGKIEGALMSGGPLFGKYKLKEFHIHFGDTKSNGTEHAINGQRYALEMHMVFASISCDGFPPKVVKAQSPFAVLTFLFEESKESPYYELFSLFSQLNQKGEKLVVTNNLLHVFKDLCSSSEYYNYIGSTTTEPFIPNVEFLVLKKILPIHKCQMDLLRQLREAGHVKPTVRSLQHVGERTVFESSYRDHIKCRGQSVCEC